MLLILSNGHGEDLLAAKLALQIRELAPEIELQSLPVVGEGAPLVQAGLPLLYPGRSFPSGGFVRSGLSYLLADIRAGFWQHWRNQGRALRKVAPAVKLTLAVGDSVLLYLSRRHLKKPLIFVPTAKSNYIRPHLPFEVRWMQETAALVFPRDAYTAEALAGQEVPARFVGNLMMDSIDLHGYDLGLEDYGADQGLPPVIGVLPGSRDEAYQNFTLLAQAAEVYANKYGKAAFPVALAGNIEAERLSCRLIEEGWVAKPETSPGVSAAFSKGKAYLLLCQGAFGDILYRSDLVLGLAGTGNEQAAGLGRPVVTFTGLGSQFTPKFVAAQKKLLGSAVSVVYGSDPKAPPAPELVANELQRILTNPEVKAEMVKTGQKRMGGPGGVRAMAQETIAFYRQLFAEEPLACPENKRGF